MIRPAALAALTISVLFVVACAQDAGSHPSPTATSHPPAAAGEDDAANPAAPPAPGGASGYGYDLKNTAASAVLRCPALGQSEPGSGSGSGGSAPSAAPGELGEGSTGGMEAPPPEGTPPLSVPPPANPVSPDAPPAPAVDSQRPPAIPPGLTLWICFARYVTPGQIDETATVVADTVPDARLEVIEGDPPIGMITLAGAPSNACDALAAALRTRDYVEDAYCEEVPPINPPGDEGSMLSIAFNESVTQDALDEVRTTVQRFEPGADLLIRESFPPTASALLPGAEACKLVVAELQSKSYIAAISCALSPVEPPSRGTGNLITVRFTESSRPEDIDEVSAFLESRGAAVPDAMIMIFPPVLSGEFPEEDPDACRLAADELQAKTYVAAVECILATPQTPLPGDANAIVSATPVAGGPAR